jgi:predicted metal-dependent phosphoesterase TrpH
MGKPCYTKVEFRSLKEIIDVIHQANGFAIIAHPGNNLAGKFELIDEMIELGLDGNEAYSSYHDEKTCEYFKNKAVEHSIIYTLGSDFYGKTKPSIYLGDVSDRFNENEVYEFLKRKDNKKD